MATEDVILQKQLPVLVLRKEEQLNAISDDKYLDILIVLREGPLTLKEITEKHNERSTKDKEEITIYRYLKDLIKLGLVIQTGKRVSNEKVATESLYCRSAKMFYTVFSTENHWESKKSKEYVRKLKRMLEEFTGKTLKDETVLKVMSSIYQVADKDISRFLENASDTLANIFREDSFGDMDVVFRAFDILMIMRQYPELEKEFQEIFDSKTKTR